MAEDLDSIFEGKTPEPVAEVKTPEPQAPEPVETVAEVGNVETGANQQGDVPPTPLIPKEDGPNVPRKALEDERKKRQEIERRFTDLERRLNDMMQPKEQVQPQQAPDPWADPEAAMTYQRNELQSAFARQMYETRVALSSEILRAQKPDFDEVIAEFVQYAQRDPGLHNAVLNHPNPAAFAYQQGQRIRFLNEVGNDPAAYKAKLREEVMAELGQGQQPAAVAQQSSPPALAPPKSLAATTSAQPRNSRGQYASGPASLDDILGG